LALIIEDAMKVCVFGAGSIGSEIGGKLALHGASVSLIARGEHLRAMQEHGLRMIQNGEELAQVPVTATDDPKTLSTQDLIIVTTKAHAVESSLAQIAGLLHQHTTVVFAMNGLPWWYFYMHGGRFDGMRLKSLDPLGMIWETIDPRRVVGAAVYLASTVSQPGEVSFVKNDFTTLHIGEPDNTISDRCKTIATLLNQSNLPTFVSEDIRREIWHKLWANIAFNPVTALTHATMDKVVEDYHDTDLIEAIMNEARFVAEKIGVSFREGPVGRIAQAAKMRGHKTSMLQDLEQGRPTEIEAIVGAVREIGKMVDVETPHLNGLYTLVRLKEKFYPEVVERCKASPDQAAA
jgi:2-dehydropantoate 2-reductase